LESFGLHCTCAGDIAAGQDALMISDYGDIDAIITNPPYTRDIMHRLITHFQRIAPTWLLLESDWTTTRQAAPFLPCCSDIVAIGRVKWVEDSKHTGKENYAWLGARPSTLIEDASLCTDGRLTWGAAHKLLLQPNAARALRALHHSVRDQKIFFRRSLCRAVKQRNVAVLTWRGKCPKNFGER
jgi:hypothetical protein